MEDNLTLALARDLRAPAESIAAFAELLRRGLGGAMDDEASRLLQCIQRLAWSMTDAIDGLLRRPER